MIQVKARRGERAENRVEIEDWCGAAGGACNNTGRG
jgi:hypothetical protein